MISFRTLCFFHLLVLGGCEEIWSVQLPQNVTALEDACVLIPCIYDIPDFESELNKSGSVYGLWIKTDHSYENNPVVFNGSSDKTLLFDRVEIIGNLSSRNCSTVFYNVNQSHADKYYFRIEMNHTRGTFIDTYVQLMVKADLTDPQLSALSSSEVAEGSVVTLNCSADTSCPQYPPTITWSIHTAKTQTHTHIQDDGHGRRTLTSRLTFTASRSHHGRDIFCTASYHRHNRSNWEANSTWQTLSVLFPPEVVEASVSPSGVLAEGSSVTLSCNSSEANPPVLNYTWFRDAQTSSPVDSGPNITLNISSNNAGIYYCRAEHPQGAKDSEQVSVRLYTPPDANNLTYLIIGVAGGSLAVLLLVVIICVARRYKPTSPQQQSSDGETSATCEDDGAQHVQVAANSLEEQQEEEIHYGEIDFSKLPLRDTSQTGQGSHGQRLGSDEERDLETEYAEVRLSGKQVTQTDDDDDDHTAANSTQNIYAKVKKSS
ncbi:sialoadhesin-like [Engraulis encrasicolus]|uniref:sialoadhesin-like n=1 Tax=Engraulis encrasicolus TaxID=184585 RepID=UPI002FD123C4